MAGSGVNPIALRLSEASIVMEGTPHPELVEMLRIGAQEIDRLDRLINNPHTLDFLQAVRLEAAHQRERWASEHDAGKADEDWLFLSGFLGGKAVQAGKTAAAFDDPRVKGYHIDKRLHHIVTAAAVLLNWHARAAGADGRMRPGIAPPESGGDHDGA